MKSLKTLASATVLFGGFVLAHSASAADCPAPVKPAPGAKPAAAAPPPGAIAEFWIQNASHAPLDVFVDQPNGGTPEPILTLCPGFEAAIPVLSAGARLRFAQEDKWVGGVVATADKKQVLRFTGKPQ